MKKLIRLFILLVMITVSGCVSQTPSKPYILDAKSEKTFGVAGETINVVVSVANPIAIDFSGNVLIQADMPKCFGMSEVTLGSLKNIEGYLTTISVESGKTNSALITMQIPQKNEQTCYQPSNHKLNLFVLQNEKVLSNMQLDFALFDNKR